MSSRSRTAAALCGAVLVSLLVPTASVQAAEGRLADGVTIEEVAVSRIYNGDLATSVTGKCDEDGREIGLVASFVKRPRDDYQEQFPLFAYGTCWDGEYVASGKTDVYRHENERLRSGETVEYSVEVAYDADWNPYADGQAWKSGTLIVG